MQLSTSTCMYFNRPNNTKAEISQSIRLCAEAGYKVMDMNFHDCCVFNTPFVDESWQEWILNIKKIADTHGITFSQGHSHFYNFCDTNIQNKEWLDILVKRCISAAGILNIPWLVIHAGTDFEADNLIVSSKKKNIEYFKPLLEFAASQNVGLAIENLWEKNIAPLHRYTSNVEELLDLVEALPYDNVGCCWDVEHASIEGQNQIKAVKLLGSRLKATHISDYTAIDNDHILPFQGFSDWNHIIKALSYVHEGVDFTFETHRYTMNMPPKIIPTALHHSVILGNYLIECINQERRMNHLG